LAETALGKVFEDELWARQLARIVVDALWDHLRHRGCLARIRELEAACLKEAQKCAALDASRLRAEAQQEALKVAWRHSYEQERALADELGQCLQHILSHHYIASNPQADEALAKWRAARQGGAQGEEGGDDR
jgi:hypothetical protein